MNNRGGKKNKTNKWTKETESLKLLQKIIHYVTKCIEKKMEEYSQSMTITPTKNVNICLTSTSDMQTKGFQEI